MEKKAYCLYSVLLLIMHHLIKNNLENLSLEDISNLFEFIEVDDTIK